MLLRDLPNLYGIRDIQELNSLFTALAYNTGQEVSLEALSQKSNVQKPTIRKYIEYLEAAFLIQSLYRVDQSGKRFRRQTQFKVYLTNPTMRAALFGELKAGQEGFGAVVETGLIDQLFHSSQQLRYARWKDKEVDLVTLARDTTPEDAIEVKWSNRPVRDNRLVSGLVTFCKSTGLDRATCTTIDEWAEHEIKGITIQFVPAAIMAYHLGLRTLQQHGVRVEKIGQVSG